MLQPVAQSDFSRGSTENQTQGYIFSYLLCKVHYNAEWSRLCTVEIFYVRMIINVTLSYHQTKDVRIKNSFLRCSHGHSTCTLALGVRCYSFGFRVVHGRTDESLHNLVRSNHRRWVAYYSYYAPTNLGTSLKVHFKFYK